VWAAVRPVSRRLGGVGSKGVVDKRVDVKGRKVFSTQEVERVFCVLSACGRCTQACAVVPDVEGQGMQCVRTEHAGSMATTRGLIVWQVPTVVAVMSTEHGDLPPHGYSKENEGGRNQPCMLQAGSRPRAAGVARRKGAGAAVTRMSRERRKARYPGRQEDGKGWRNQNAYQNGQMQAPVTLRCNRRDPCVWLNCGTKQQQHEQKQGWVELGWVSM
jgi:hypothetical protein